MDEKGFLLGVIHKTRRIVSKVALENRKIRGTAQDGSREWISLLGSACMDGTALPAAIIYAAESGNLQDTWVDSFNPSEDEAYFASSPNGWTSDELGFDWLHRVFDRCTKKKARNGRDPRLLIVDGHGSHLNMTFLNWCEKHNVHVCVFPPHSTHRLQPLDVSVFGPLAHYYQKELDAWLHRHGALSSLSKREFWSLFKPAFEKSFTKHNIESGFEKTGLNPLNPAVVLDQIRPESSSSASSGSSFSKKDLSAIRRAVRQGAIKAFTQLVPTLITRYEAVEAQNQLLKGELQAVENAAKLKKKRRKRGVKLIKNLPEISQGKAIFFSPKKIAQAREILETEQREKEQVEAQKTENKIQAQLRREAKQEEVAERKVQREEARKKKEAERQEEAARKATAKLAKQQAQQRQQGSKPRKGKALKAKEAPPIASSSKEQAPIVISDVEGEGADFRAARPRRQINLPQRLKDCET